MEAPEQDALRRPLWQLRLLSSAIKEGSGFTPRLTFPPEFWSKGGFRMAGMQPKIQAFQRLHIALTRARDHTKLPDAESVDRILVASRQFLLEAEAIQSDLSRLFASVPPVESAQTESEEWNVEQMSLGRLAGYMSSVASSVRKKASTVVERVGTAVPVRLSEDDMKNYADFVVRIGEDCQTFDACLVAVRNLVEPTAETENKPKSPKGGDNSSIVSAKEELERVSVFFQEVVCEVILRDVEILVEQHLRLEMANFVEVAPPTASNPDFSKDETKV